MFTLTGRLPSIVKFLDRNTLVGSQDSQNMINDVEEIVSATRPHSSF